MINANIRTTIEELELQKFFWIIFIINYILNIEGIDLQEKGFQEEDYSYISKSEKIFIFTLVVSLIINLYFLYQNYKSWKEVKGNLSEKERLYFIRLIGSVLIIIGSILNLYNQINNRDTIGTEST